MLPTLKPAGEGLRTRVFQIIFESDTPLAKGFEPSYLLLAAVAVGGAWLAAARVPTRDLAT